MLVKNAHAEFKKDAVREIVMPLSSGERVHRMCRFSDGTVCSKQLTSVGTSTQM